MRATGIVRKIDELGRITLPIELRRSFNLEEKDPIEILIDNDCIVLRKMEISDIFTNEVEDLVEYKGKLVSKASIIELAKLAGLTVSE